MRSLLTFAMLAITAHKSIAQPTVSAAREFVPGFRLLVEHDYSRTIGPKRDFEGREHPGEIARPMQVGIWYPSRSPRSAARTSFGDYRLLSIQADSRRAVSDADRMAARDDIRSFARFALGRELNEAEVTTVFDRRLDAVRDALPAPGRFPVVIAGSDGALSTGAQLFEQLARRGIVVVATPSLRAMAALQVTKPAIAIDTRVRDLEYLADRVRSLPFVAADRMVVLGINFDGMAALLYQMKNMSALGVVSIDGWEGKQNGAVMVRQSPYYDPLRIRVPYLVVQQDEASVPPPLALDSAVFGSLRYSTREHLVIRGLSHAYLVGSAALYPRTPEPQQAGYARLIERITTFVVDVSSDRSPRAATNEASSLFKEQRRELALRPAPYDEEIERIVMGERGAERLREVFRAARADNPDVKLFTRQSLDLFRFRLTRMQRAPDTLVLLELATEAFPTSVDARDNIGANVAGPGTRAGHVLTYDPQRGVTLLLGGDSEDRPLRETLWAWDGSRWRVQAGSGPSYRTLPAAAFDTRRGVLVVYGGIGPVNGNRYGDVWEWDGRQWTERNVSTPGARDHHAMAYDEARGVTVLFGGQDANRAMPRGTWTWNGTTWSLVDSTSGPGGLVHHAMAYDARRGRLVLFGGFGRDGVYSGETWEWDGQRWSRVATTGPAARARHRMAYDVARGMIVLHGGTLAPRPGQSGFDYAGDTWGWDGVTWREITKDGPRRDVHAIAFDARRSRLVLHGGGSPDGQNSAETWELDGSTWRPVSPPPPR